MVVHALEPLSMLTPFLLLYRVGLFAGSSVVAGGNIESCLGTAFVLKIRDSHLHRETPA